MGFCCPNMGTRRTLAEAQDHEREHRNDTGALARVDLPVAEPSEGGFADLGPGIAAGMQMNDGLTGKAVADESHRVRRALTEPKASSSSNFTFPVLRVAYGDLPIF